MSRLAHATFAARGVDMRQKRRELDKLGQAEIVEAKRLQRTLGCTWTEALKLAKENLK